MRVRTAALLILLAATVRAVAEEPQTRPGDPNHRGHDHDATARHPFDDVEQWKAVFDDPARDDWQQPNVVTRELGLRPGMAIADIGAGTGYFEPFFAHAVGPEGKVYAVDIEPKMVAHLKERARRENTPIVVPVLALPGDPKLPDGSIDVIFICDTFHHIDDRIDYIRRLGRALKPGGSVAVVDFHKKPLPVGPPPEHKIAREAVLAEFDEAGWRLSRESAALPFQYFLIFQPPSPPG